MNELKLFMLLLGCKPKGRHTEQHDILFAIGNSLKELIPEINNFWQEAKGKIHIDAWREVSHVNGFKIKVIAKTNSFVPSSEKLFFLNLGGYKPNEFEEYHYKVLSVNKSKSEAIYEVKQTVFFRHNLSTHIDDKYGVDVDDIYDVEEILSAQIKEKYTLQITKDSAQSDDELHTGYYKLSAL